MKVAEQPKSSLAKADEAFEQLYLQAFSNVARYVANRGGSFDDARDIFQDALVIWWEQHNEAGSKVHTSTAAYVTGIAKHLWLRHARNNSNVTQLAATATHIPAPAKELNVNERSLLQLLETTGRKCMDLLRSIYYNKKTPAEIAATHNYSSEHSASVQKYKCLEKIRDTVKERSLEYEAFID